MMGSASVRRVPGILILLVCLVATALAKGGGGVTTATVKPTGKPYIVSVGINKYPTKNTALTFSNCVRDAQAYDQFFKKQFSAIDRQRSTE